MLRGLINRIQLALRKDYFGKIQLRSGLPIASMKQQIKDENRYYSQLFSAPQTLWDFHDIRTVIDIGCRNWSYLFSLAEAFPFAKLIGVELDAYRRYWNLYRRIDLANAYASSIHLKGRSTEVFAGDFRTISFPELKSPILFCFIFPFVSQNPCLQWGLPEEHADYRSLLKHAERLTRDSKSKAYLFAVHQGEWEAKIARDIYASMGIRTEEVCLSPDSWEGIWPSIYENYIFFAEIPS